MGIEKRRRDKKERFLLVFLVFFLLLAGISLGSGAAVIKYLSSFSRDAGKNLNAVKDKTSPVNILLMGVDIGTAGSKNENDPKRTDTIMLVNYNPKTEELNLVSIPRDTLIRINGKNQKINAAHAIGGVPYLIDCVEKMLDLKVNYYGKIDYAGFRELIDAMGGVEMKIAQRMEYDDPGQNLHIHFKKGETVHLDGKKAEEFFRWRKNNDGTGLADGDLGRIKNQHLFVEKVMEKFKSVAIIPKLPEILRVVPKYAETNMTGEEILRYGKLLAKVGRDNMKMSTLKGDLVDIDNSSYFVYDEDQNNQVLEVLHYLSTNDRVVKLDRENLKIQVLNCTGRNGMAAAFQKEIRALGYRDVTIGNGSKTAKTAVTAYGIKKEQENSVKEDFGLANIVFKQEKQGQYDIVVLLGDDYKK